MAGFGKKISWNRQPQYPMRVVQTFSKRNVFTFNSAAGNVNLVDGASSGAVGAGITKTVGAKGVGYKFDATQAEGSLSWGTSYNPFAGAAGLTLVVTYIQTNASAQRKLFGKWGATPHTFLLSINTSSYPFLGVGASTNIEVYRSDSSAGVIGVENTLVARWNGKNGAGGYAFWLNGKKSGAVAVSDSGDPTSIASNTTNNFQIGRDSTADGSPFLGNIYQISGFYGGLTDEECCNLSLNPNLVFQPLSRNIFVGSAAGGTAALTGTISDANEGDIVSGGKTIILTLTGDTWVAAGATFDAQRQNIINGLDSAQTEATGWDAVVKALQGVSGVIRTSDTVVTITLDAQATYNITATETITATITATAVSLGAQIVASPTFAVTATTAGGWLNRGYFWNQTYGHMAR